MIDKRYILPTMISVSRDCRRTRQVAKAVTEKLTPEEMEAFYRWLQVIEQDQRVKINQAKRHGYPHF